MLKGTSKSHAAAAGHSMVEDNASLAVYNSAVRASASRHVSSVAAAAAMEAAPTMEAAAAAAEITAAVAGDHPGSRRTS
jgi:hypothetical protein